MEQFRTVYSEHTCLWYIEDSAHRKVRIKNPTTGVDTGVNKSYVLQRTAQAMCDRLNKGEKPRTVAIP